MGDKLPWILLGVAGILSIVAAIAAYMLHEQWNARGARSAEELFVAPPPERPVRETIEIVQPPTTPAKQISDSENQQDIQAQPNQALILFSYPDTTRFPRGDDEAWLRLFQIGQEEFLLRWLTDPRIGRAEIENGKIVLTIYSIFATITLTPQHPEYEALLKTIRQAQGRQE